MRKLWEKLFLKNKLDSPKKEPLGRAFAAKRGMTLIEIISAIAILGIISVALLTAMTTYYRLMGKTKHVTQAVFILQEEMEESISDTKNKLRNNQAVTLPLATYTLFAGQAHAVDVNGFRINKNVNAHAISTVVSTNLSLPLPVPILDTVKINKNSNNRNYAADSSLQLTGEYSYSSQTDLFFAKFQWYVSREGYNLQLYGDPEEIEVGARYPRFPDDFEPIIGATALSLSNLSNYSGRHIVFAVTPVANSMKMGETKYSAPLFLYGPPVIDNLRYHLDASVLNKDDNNICRKDANDAYYLRKWPNLAGLYLSGTAIPDLTASTTSSQQPAINEFAFNLPDIPEVWGRTVGDRANPADKQLTVSNYASSSANPAAITFFMMVKISPDRADKTILAGTNASNVVNWELKTTADRTLELNKGSNGQVAAAENVGMDGEFHLLTGRLSRNNLSLQIDRLEANTTSTSNANLQTRNLLMNLAGLEVGELLIYHTDLDAASTAKVQDFLLNKYDPDTVPWQISKLKDIFDEVPQNKDYIMPGQALAIMTNGATMPVDVVWEGSIDTSHLGEQTVIGHARVDPAKKVILSVKVIGLASVDDVTDSVRIGSPYTMPSTVTATFTDGSLRPLAVSWNGVVNTATAGIKTVTGQLIDYPTYNVTLTVSVLHTAVSQISLNHSTYTLQPGGAVQLTATILPVDADVKEVGWSVSPGNVVNVDGNGLVTTRGVGTATVTATSLDNPSLQATCVITVEQEPIYLSNLVLEQRETYGSRPRTRWNNLSLEPSFTQAGTNYGVTMSGNWDNVIRITPSVARGINNATIRVNGTSVSSGNSITFNRDSNPVQTIVVEVSRPGYSSTTYTVNVTPPPLPAIYLTGLTVQQRRNNNNWNNMTLYPGFSGTNTSYTASMTSSWQDYIRITATAQGASVTITNSSGSSYTSGATIPQNRNRRETYTITVSRNGYSSTTYTLIVN